MHAALQELMTKYEHEAETLRTRYYDPLRAALFTLFVSDLEHMLRTASEETLTLAEASQESGYSADHLGRLLRDGTLSNAGRKNAPRIRRRDIPRKSGLRADATCPKIASFDRTRIAESIASAQRGD